MSPNQVPSLLAWSKKATAAAVVETKNSEIKGYLLTMRGDLNRTKLTVLLKVYFDFMYYLCVSPVRFVQDQETGHFYEISWLPQKIVSVILNLLCTYPMVCSVRKNILIFTSLSNRKPEGYLEIFLQVIGISYKVYGMKTFWGHRHVQALNCIMTEPNLLFRCKQHQNKLWMLTHSFAYTLYGGFLILTILAAAIGQGIVSSFLLWTPSLFLRKLARLAKATFYFESPTNFTTEAPELSAMSTTDWTVTMLMLLGYIQRHILGYFLDVGILAAVLTLNVVAKLLDENIKGALQFENQHQVLVPVVPVGAIINPPVKALTWTSICNQFQAIQNLCDKINSALGSQVTFYLAEGLIYYSGNLSSVMVTVDPYEKFHLTILFLMTVFILKTAADIGCHMSSIKLWLRKSLHRHQAPLVEVSLVLHELANNEIGLKGSGMFTVTYGFLGGFLGLVITFFMISLQ